MELKSVNSVKDKSQATASNRTIMELKCKELDWIYLSWGFQSHHNGIEMRITTVLKLHDLLPIAP